MSNQMTFAVMTLDGVKVSVEIEREDAGTYSWSLEGFGWAGGFKTPQGAVDGYIVSVGAWGWGQVVAVPIGHNGDTP